MNKVTWWDRVKYAFDNTLAQGPIALVGWLGVASAVMVAVATLIVWLFGAAYDMSLPIVFWNVLFQALTPGPIDFSAGSWFFVLIMLIVALGGIFIVSILVGVLTTGIEDRLQLLRKGRSRVLEADHSVILGWNEHIFTIVPELVIANENRSRPCIVVMGNKDKVEMEDEIRDKVGPTGKTRIVCRSGDPIDIMDLEIVSLNTARSILVLAPEDDDDPDASVIKTLLAIVNHPQRRPEPYRIVAEIHDEANLDAARLVGGEEVELVLVGRLTSYIVAQTCRRSGLSIVYTELLNFEGDEIYFKNEPGLTGKSFGEALMAYEDSTVMGLRPKGGHPVLNPPMDTILKDGDQLIAISADDDTLKLSGRKDFEINSAAIRQERPEALRPERTLILGWNWRAPIVISELENYVAPGSAVMVVADDATLAEQIEPLRAGLKNQQLEFRIENTTDAHQLEQLGLDSYQHVIVLSYSDRLPMQKADARTLITLLHLREIGRKMGKRFSIVSEMLDKRNRDLAEVTHADDFIVSGKLSSLLLAQIMENHELHAVFAGMLSSEGAEIYLKPAGDYVKPGVALNFYTVMEAVRRQNGVAIGYRVQALSNDAGKSYGVVINPNKSESITFAEDDRIIVLAETE